MASLWRPASLWRFRPIPSARRMQFLRAGKLSQPVAASTVAFLPPTSQACVDHVRVVIGYHAIKKRHIINTGFDVYSIAPHIPPGHFVTMFGCLVLWLSLVLGFWRRLKGSRGVWGVRGGSWERGGGPWRGPGGAWWPRGPSWGHLGPRASLVNFRPVPPRRPKTGQEGPRPSQDGPKLASRRAQRPPRRPKRPPRRPRRGARRPPPPPPLKKGWKK